MSTNEKNPFSRYFDIFYNNMTIKKRMSRRFMIYFLRSFAYKKSKIDKAIRSIINKSSAINIDHKLDIDKYLATIKNDTDLPPTIATYVTGTDRNLSEEVRSACLPMSKRSDVRTRIAKFLKDYISPNAHQKIINKIKNLFQEIQSKELTDEKLLELDQLIQENKIIDYFRDTFQLILDAEYKQDELVAEEAISEPNLTEENKSENLSSNEIDQIFKNSLFSENILLVDSSYRLNKIDLVVLKTHALISSNNINEIRKALEDTIQHGIIYCDIAYFIESDPNISLDPKFFYQLIYFIEIIESVLDNFVKYEEEEIYQNIKEFNVVLDQYKKYLDKNMRPSPDDTNIWIPVNRKKRDDIDVHVRSYRMTLANQYNKFYNDRDKWIIVE